VPLRPVGEEIRQSEWRNGKRRRDIVSKQRRTVLSGVVTPISPPQGPEAQPPPARLRPRTVQQTVYLTPAVHDQLRELAFAERVKMHTLLMEGLDLVFRARGLKLLSELARSP
jgi:hypothetical protein